MSTERHFSDLSQAELNGDTTYPIRQRSANGKPTPTTHIERTCAKCKASFLGLAPGKTGERGIWADWNWYCSIECAPGQDVAS